jgi:hypothetical protein
MGEDGYENEGGRRAFRTPPPKGGNEDGALTALLRPVAGRNTVPIQLNFAEIVRPEERSNWLPWRLT